MFRFASGLTGLAMAVAAPAVAVATGHGPLFPSGTDSVAPMVFDGRGRPPRAAIETPPAVPSLAIDLGRLPPRALAASGTSPVRGPLPIGLGRALAGAPALRLEPAALVWESRGDGSRAASLTVRSPGAAAVRIGVGVVRLPAEAGLRFFRPGDTESGPLAVSGGEVGALLDPAGDGRGGLYWSPVIEGEEVGLEIVLPSGVAGEELDLGIPMVSHLWRSPLQSAHIASDIGSSGFCEVDLRCGTGDWIGTGQAVAKIAFSDASGASYICTGTLLNDRAGSGTPYFLTAEHCIDSPAAAASIETYWFFEAGTCGSFAPIAGSPTRGGATLLSRATLTDYAFLRLNASPPAGVTFAGWSADPVALSAPVVGIHHPEGDLKKLSSGRVTGFHQNLAGTNGQASIEATWSSGVTEPGSSGSGLFDANGRLLGVLSWGWSTFNACFSPESYYGRFDWIYPQVRQWLEAPATPSAVPSNISSRAPVRPGDEVLIGGFILEGTEPKTVVVRGLGPSMAAAGVPGTLENPTLDLYSGQTRIASNDDWQSDPGAATVAAFGLAPPDGRESAILATLAPGPYTAIVRGAGGASGVGLVAVEDPAPGGATRLRNISSRSLVLGGDDVLIAGFIVSGSGTKTVVVRALGPSLTDLGVPGALADPELEVYSGSMVMGANDDWESTPGAADLAAAGLAPPHRWDSAVRLTLPPGPYTAIVRGVLGATGVGLVAVDVMQ